MKMRKDREKSHYLAYEYNQSSWEADDEYNQSSCPPQGPWRAITIPKLVAFKPTPVDFLKLQY